jgi:hypothetical protein
MDVDAKAQRQAFRYFARLARLSGEKEKRELQFELHVPSLVARTGIEPVTFGL